MNVPKIIALTGYAGSGKDTCADWICETYGHTKIAFADPLKDIVSTLVYCPLMTPGDMPKYMVDLFYECNKQWKASGVLLPGDFVRAKPYSPELRKLLQHVGTEYYRAKDSKYWIKSMHLDPGKKYVISDMRFHDECAFAKAIGAATIYVHRPDIVSNDKHASEASIKSLPVDYALTNKYGELADTFGKLDTMLCSFFDNRKDIPLVEV
jgi:hypothetical protein